MADRRYSVYWDTYDENEWKALQTTYEAERKQKLELEQSTIDVFRIATENISAIAKSKFVNITYQVPIKATH